MISDPYERMIAELGKDEIRSVRFALLRDVDELSIVLRHSGREEVRRVRLTQGASGPPLTLRSDQLSQDGELGSEVAFRFRAERFARDEQDYELVITGLPDEIGYAFYNPENEVRLSRLSFPASSSARDLELRIHLPREPSPLVMMDQAIRFEIGCSPMESRRMGAVLALELIPRGVGAFSIEISNLYRELTKGESVEIEARLENIGSRRIENLRIETVLPLDWHAEMVPPFIERLDQESSVALILHIEPPASVAVGDYEVRIRAEATALGRPIRGDEKLVRLHLKPKMSLFGIVTIGILLVAVFGGLIVLGLYLAKR